MRYDCDVNVNVNVDDDIMTPAEHLTHYQIVVDFFFVAQFNAFRSIIQCDGKKCHEIHLEYGDSEAISIQIYLMITIMKLHPYKLLTQRP